MTNTLSLVGYANGHTSNDGGCALGPEIFKQSAAYALLKNKHPAIIWDKFFSPNNSIVDKTLQTKEICQQLAQLTRQYAEQHQRFIVLGGDHSSAIGTWSGVYDAMHTKGNIGLIWVDAHMDAHTPETSITGNIHGMPLAVLLGQGSHELTQLMNPSPKLLPENICLIGIRSFESGEAALLKKLGVRIFNMKEVEERGLPDVFKEAVSIVQKNTVGFGLSIDLDAIDPNEAPGVGTPAVKGLSADQLVQAVAHLFENPHFLAAEIVEFNPTYDKEHKTEKVISALIDSMV